MNRQAVILIHGIGEQRPMDTVRGFADQVLPLSPKHGCRYWSKPDAASESFELRRLRGAVEPVTDVYEFYWAHHVEGTKLEHIWHWFKTLLIRWPWKVPSHLIPLWCLSWLLVLIAALMALYVLFGGVGVGHSWSSRLGGGLIGALALLLEGFLLDYIGDAARYLMPTPKNIQLRQTIRKEGLRLLQRLHEDQRYDRIVVIGHSLGSVIGYDLVRYAWQLLAGPYPNASLPQTALAENETTGEALKAGEADQLAYRACQSALDVSERACGSRWRVTDLVTLGSPLAHAALLMANDAEELAQRQGERELPTCPPVAEAIEGKDRYSYAGSHLPGGSAFFTLHHAAAFATTRWTNVFFPARLGLFGDIVGGPLKKVFGPGVQDIVAASTAWGGVKALTPASHTSYWSKGSEGVVEVIQRVLGVAIKRARAGN